LGIFIETSYRQGKEVGKWGVMRVTFCVHQCGDSLLRGKKPQVTVKFLVAWKYPNLELAMQNSTKTSPRAKKSHPSLINAILAVPAENKRNATTNN